MSINDARFGRLSKGGKLACGAVQVSVDGVVVGPGTTPVWLDEATVVYTRQPDGAMMQGWPLKEPLELRPPAHEPSSLCVSPSGVIAWREKDGVHTSKGRFVEGVFRPTWAGEDLCWCVDTGRTADLYREGQLVARDVHDIRGEADGRLCYTQQAGAASWTCIQHPDGRVAGWQLLGAEEYRPHVIDWRGEEWVLSHTRDDRLLLRTGSNGILVATGATFEPDAVVLQDGRVRVIWADERGISQERMLSAAEPQVDLRKRPPAAAPWPDVDAADPGPGWRRRDDITRVDVLEYLLGTQPWSRNGMHLPADATTYTHHFQSRRVEQEGGSGFVQQVKVLGQGARDATWTYTKDWIGLAFDGTNELGAAQASSGYRFCVPGTQKTAALYPRVMPVGRRAVAASVELVDVRTSTPLQRLKWEGWVEGVFENTLPIGDIPAGTLHASIIFHPGADDTRSWKERNICAQGYGSWYWHQQKVATGVVDKRWVGTRNVARVFDPPSLYTNYPPALPTVQPPPPQEPPMPQWSYNDADATRIIDFLALKYTTPSDLGGLGRDSVDHLGYARWLHDAIRLLDSGRSIDAALREINRRINEIVGLPPAAWPGEEPPPPPPPPPSSRLKGPLRIASDGRSFVDDGGDVLPVVCHLGDGLSRWMRDPGGVLVELSAIADAGYDGVRAWTVLGGSSYWAGREISPEMGEAYWTAVRGFVSALRSFGLRWLVSGGDMLRLLPTRGQRQAFMMRLAQELTLEDVLGVDAGNEALWNGETSATEMRHAVEAFRSVLPCGVWSLTSPGGEEKADLDTYSGSVFDVHGYRGGRFWDKLRHMFSIVYEQQPSKRLGIQSEPFGPGALVSASENKAELTTEVMQLAVAQSLLSRQMWVYFCGAGVKSDAGERLSEAPGFREIPSIARQLPRDVMRFSTLCHGGASQRGRRIFAVPGTDETRADHAISADGRFVVCIYGPSWRGVTQERAATIHTTILCGDAGSILIGSVE